MLAQNSHTMRLQQSYRPTRFSVASLETSIIPSRNSTTFFNDNSMQNFFNSNQIFTILNRKQHAFNNIYPLQDQCSPIFSKETWEGVETGHKLDLFKFLWLLLLGRCLGFSTCLSGAYKQTRITRLRNENHIERALNMR